MCIYIIYIELKYECSSMLINLKKGDLTSEEA